MIDRSVTESNERLRSRERLSSRALERSDLQWPSESTSSSLLLPTSYLVTLSHSRIDSDSGLSGAMNGLPTSPTNATAAAGGSAPPPGDSSSENLWSSILDSVSSSRGVSTKNCIVLGELALLSLLLACSCRRGTELAACCVRARADPFSSHCCIVAGAPRSGKSTLVSRLGSVSGEAPKVEVKQGDKARSDVLDLGLSYSVIDVRDEGDGGTFRFLSLISCSVASADPPPRREIETLARLGTYQLPSPSPPYPSLLPLALSRATLLDSLVVITLDWERPWAFLRELRAWMGVLDALIAKNIGEGVEVQEGRERRESISSPRHARL